MKRKLKLPNINLNDPVEVTLGRYPRVRLSAHGWLNEFGQICDGQENEPGGHSYMCDSLTAMMIGLVEAALNHPKLVRKGIKI